MRRIPFDIKAYHEQMKKLLGNTPHQEVFWAALDFAVDAHWDQWRKSGDAYILHPCRVAQIMVEEMDISHPEILAAALLHDTVEDVEEVTGQVVRDHFGSYVQDIVEGCTKVTHVSGDKQQNSQRTHRKIFSGAALRPEVMLVKLADRLHNLRTLHALPQRKRQRIADETIDIYAPLATVFGLFNVKREMYNLALMFKYPKQGAKVKGQIEQLKRDPLAQEIAADLKTAIDEYQLPARVSVRVKELWAYYDAANKILLKEIETPMEVIIVVEDRHSCYRALGIINETFRPIPRTIRDFIANPKPTGYQGLHARAIIQGQKFLFKTRTDSMERMAQRGLFRNWSSREGTPKKFVKEIQELFDVLGTNESFSYRDVIAASGQKEVYTYTPQGDLICLPVKSTVLDFAFRVHTEIGRTCLGGMIRNKRVPADHVLTDGAMVRVIRAPEPIRFDQNMINICQTPRARAELARGFKVRRRKVTKRIGESLLRQEMLRYGFPFTIFEGENLDTVLSLFRLDDIDKLYGRIGEGRLRLYDVMTRLKTEMFGGESPLYTPTGAFNKIELTTLDPVSVKLSSCCKPNPTQKDNCALLTEKGLSVHHKHCERLQEVNFRREDVVDITWRTRVTHVYKQQELHILKASRDQVMTVLGGIPLDVDVTNLQKLTSYSTKSPAWQVNFNVANLYVLQKALKHFDRSHLPYEFYLES